MKTSNWLKIFLGNHRLSIEISRSIFYTVLMKKLTKLCDSVKGKLKSLRADLHCFCAERIMDKGLRDGTVKPFDQELYEQMSHTYVNGVPVSIDMKYLRPTIGPGKCYDRSLNMFLCFDDALLVRGDLKDLELRFSKEDAGHGWIERGGYAYDPSLLHKCPVDIYYKIFGVSNVRKCSHAEYAAIPENKKFYDKVRNTTLQDYQPNGKYRLDLLTTIPLVKGIAEVTGNIEFQQELERYLDAVQYDEAQIYQQLKDKTENLLADYIEKLIDKEI